jgi:hypothetical protein
MTRGLLRPSLLYLFMVFSAFFSGYVPIIALNIKFVMVIFDHPYVFLNA